MESAVFVECGLSDSAGALAEAQWACHTLWANIKAYVAAVPVYDGRAGVNQFLDKLRIDGALPPILKGARVVMHQLEEDVCSGPVYIDGVQACGEHGLSYDICCRPTQLPAVLKLVEQCSDVIFILDHLGFNGGTDEHKENWRWHMDLLAQFPNVFVKCGGSEEWLVKNPAEYIEHVIRTFGPDRCLAESNWFVSHIKGLPYTKSFDLITEACNAANVSSEKMRAVFQDNARRVYRF